MKSKLYSIIIFILVLLLIVALPILWKVSDILVIPNDLLWIYITAKVIATLSFIVVFLLTLWKKKAPSVSFILLLAATIYQVVPLLMRVLLVEELQIWSITSLIVLTTVYLAVTFGVLIMNDKMIVSEQKYQGNQIPVKEESTYQDDHGNFKGCA